MSQFNFGNSTNSSNNLFGNTNTGFSSNTTPANGFGQTTGQFGSNAISNNSTALFSSPKAVNTQQLGANLSNTAFGSNGGSLFSNSAGGLNPTNVALNSGATTFGSNNASGFNSGAASVTPAATTFSFGQNNSMASKQSSNMFGTATSNTSVFGNVQQSSPFGNAQIATQNNSFGNASQNKPFGGSTTTPTFGGATQSGSFGNTTAGPSLFGNTNTTFGTTGQLGSSNQVVPFGIPAQSNTLTANNSAFGTSAQTSNLFGNTSQIVGIAQTNQQPTMFGNTQQSAPFGSTTQSSVFGTTNQQSNFGTNNQTTAFGTNNQSATFGTNNQSASFGTNNQTTPFGSNNQTTPFGSINQTTPFGSNNQTTPFGTNSQTNAFGVNAQPTAFGATNQTTAFGTTKPQSAFGAAPQPSAFGTTNQQTTFGTTSQPTSFGTANQQTAFGTANTPTALGTTTQPTAFGTAIQPASFGTATQPAAFGTVTQPTTFGTTTQPTAFGASNQTAIQSAPFGSSTQQPTFGAGTQPNLFGNATQSTPFGTANQSLVSGTVTQQTSLGTVNQPSLFGGATQASTLGSTTQSSTFGNALNTITANASQPLTFGNTTTNAPNFGATQQSNPMQLPSFGSTTTTATTTGTSFVGAANTSFGSVNQSSLGSSPKIPFGGLTTSSAVTTQPTLSFGGNTTSLGFGGTSQNSQSPQTNTTTSSGFGFGGFSVATTAVVATTPSNIVTLNSVIAPVIGSSITVSTATTTPISTASNGELASKQPFSFNATSTPFSINSGTVSQGSTAANTSTPSGFTLSSNSLCASSSSVQPQSSIGLGGVATTKAPFTSPLAVASTNAKKGLGGSPVLALNGSVQAKEEAQSSSGSKGIKDTELPQELKETVETFKKYVTEQKKLREEIVKSHDAMNLIIRVDEECQTFGQSISEVSNGLLKIQSQYIKLKNNVLKEQSNIKIAQTNADSSFGISGGLSESSSYFTSKSRDFENRASLYQQEIEVVESLNKPAARSSLATVPGSSKDLVAIIRAMDDEFMGLAARLYMVHEQVKAAKADYLRRRVRIGQQQSGNPFLAIEGRYGDGVGVPTRVTTVPTVTPAVRPSDLVGGSPFETGGYRGNQLSLTTTATVAAPVANRPAVFGFNSNSSAGSTFGFATAASPVFGGGGSRPGNLFSTDAGSNKKRR